MQPVVEVKEEGLLSLFRSVFFILILQILSLVILLPSHYAENTVNGEYRGLATLIGHHGGNYIILNANKTYAFLVKDTGLENAVNGLFAPTADSGTKLSKRFSDISEKFLPFFRDRAKSFLYTTYLVILRVCQIFLWFWPLLVLGIPLLIDAYYGWKKRKLGYDGASPTSQSAALQFSSRVVITGVCVLFLPVVLPIWVVPTVLLVLLVSLSVVIRNLYK